MQPVNNALLPAAVAVATSSLQLTLLVNSIIRFRESRPGSLLSDDSTFFLLHQLFCVTLKLVAEALALAAAHFSTLSGWFPRFQAASVLIALTMQVVQDWPSPLSSDNLAGSMAGTRQTPH